MNEKNISYDELEEFFSRERLNKYLVIANGNKDLAVKLYEKNLKYSSGLQLVLSCFETFLRNRINKEMVKYDKDWILNLIHINNKIINNIKADYNRSENTFKNYEKFFEIQNKLVDEARNSLQEDSKPLTNDYLVSRLTFGFWTRLFSKNYKDIWDMYLYKIFYKSAKRGFIEKNLNRIRKLRNRIAHNESIINLKHRPTDYYNLIISFSFEIEPRFAEWLEKHSSRDLFI